MDDIKQKLFGFINKQVGQSKESPTSPSDVYLTFPIENSAHCSRTLKSDMKRKEGGSREILDKVLESIEKDYFGNVEFDSGKHELQKLPEDLNCDIIERNCEQLQQQQKAVSHKLFELILQKEKACSDELLRILDIQQELQSTLRICHDVRTHLNSAKQQFTTSSLGILANYQKRQVVKNLIYSLSAIKTLQQTAEHLQELLNEGNFPGAISLLVECQTAASTYRQFTCVAALGSKLQDTLELAEEQLDQALAKVCNHFDADHYGKVQDAYGLLGRTQIAMDQLHMHFVSAVHNATFNVVHGYVELCSSLSRNSHVTLQKKDYRELCKFVTADSFIPCLRDLCKSLWEIMRSYNQVIIWHERKDDEKLSTDASSNPLEFEISFNKEYVKQKLNNGLIRIWQDIQTRISVYLLSSELGRYKFDEFLNILGVIHRLIEIGEEFCGSKSEDLQNSVRKQSINYFKNYHYGCLDELRIFLENEGWEICPVKPSFNIIQLQEFKLLRHNLKCWKAQCSLLNQSDTSNADNTSSGFSQDGSIIGVGYFSKYTDSRNPFDIGNDDTQEEDILADLGDEHLEYFSEESDDDIPDELKKDIIDENAGDTASSKYIKPVSKRYSRRELMKAPILTNTALTVLRHCGKYLQMSHLLQPIACDVIICMSQLFDLYLYTVYSFFSRDLPVDIPCTSHFLYNLKLQAALKRIQDSIVMLDSDFSDPATEISEKSKGKIYEPHLALGVDLAQPDTLFGLSERMIAVESLIYLAEQFEFLQSYLKQRLPLEFTADALSQFYLQTVSLAVELRRPVYMCVSAKAVDFHTILSLMTKVNWEVKEVMSQHSDYVDILLRQLQIFTMRLEQLAYRVPISHEVLYVLWENVLQLTCNMFVEGFSTAKKCSNGGRALMQLDFTQFLSKIERLTPVKPVPGKEYVESYVKAYYQRESEIEVWIKEHREYSTKQLLALVNCACACQSSKKVRQRLLSLVEDLDRIRY